MEVTMNLKISCLIILSMFLETYGGGPRMRSSTKVCRNNMVNANRILHAFEESLVATLDEFANTLYAYDYENPYQKKEHFINAVNPFWIQANSSFLIGFNEAKSSIAAEYGVGFQVVDDLFKNLEEVQHPFLCIKFVLKIINGVYQGTLKQAAHTFKTLLEHHD